MMRRVLGGTGLSVSPLGLGTVKLGRDQGVKYPAGFRIPDDDEARNLIALARELGINLIDTAPAYGNSEERLGELLAGQRGDWVICTKVGEEFEHGRSRFDFSPAHLRHSVERSLKRLRTDRLELVLVHSDGQDEERVREDGVLETLERLRGEGKLIAFGLSSKTVTGGMLSLEQADTAMITLNLAEREEAAVAAHAAALGKGVLIKKALASGHVCADSGAADPVQQSFDFIFAQPGVCSVIVGTITPDHLRHNVRCATEALQQAG